MIPWKINSYRGRLELNSVVRESDYVQDIGIKPILSETHSGEIYSFGVFLAKNLFLVR